MIARSSPLPQAKQTPRSLLLKKGGRPPLTKGLNNRAENAHQPTRRRERQMKRFKSPGQAQRFLSAHDQINNLFRLRRDHRPAIEYRAARTQAFQTWVEVTGVAATA
jgi:putative transposase